MSNKNLDWEITKIIHWAKLNPKVPDGLEIALVQNDLVLTDDYNANEFIAKLKTHIIKEEYREICFPKTCLKWWNFIGRPKNNSDNPKTKKDV